MFFKGRLYKSMSEIIITILTLWLFIKILKAIFSGWSKSDYQRDR